MSPALKIGGSIAALGLVLGVLAVLLAGNQSSPSESTDPAAEERMTPSDPTASRASALEARGTVAAARIESTAIRTGIGGRVLDEEGTVIAGATVTVEETRPAAPGATRLEDPLPVGQVQSDESGAFEVIGLDAGRYDVVAESPGLGFIGRSGIGVEAGRVARIDLVLAPRPEHLGRVVGPAGEAVVGAEILIHSSWGFGGSQGAIRRVSDSGGWFSFSEPASSQFAVVTLLARKSGIGRGFGYLHGNDLAQVHEVCLKPVSTDVLPEPGSIAGVVIDRTSSRPVSGVPLEACLSSGLLESQLAPHSGQRNRVRATSDADGKFTLNGLPRDRISITTGSRWVVSQQGNDTGSITQSLKETPRVEGLSVTVVEGGTVEGTVVDESGRPVEGVTVDFGLGILIPESTTTDGAGWFRLRGIHPATRCQVAARRPHVPVARSAVFEMLPGATVTGISITITNNPAMVIEVVGIDGRRIEGVAIEIQDGQEDPHRSTHRTGPDGRAVIDSLKSNRVALSVDPGSLPPGSQLDDDFRMPFLHSQELTLVVLRLRPEVVIHGKAVLDDGTPVPGIIRFDVRNDSAASFDGRLFTTQQNRSSGEAKPRFARVDSQGDFTLRVRSLREYHVTEVSRVVRRPGSDHPELEVFVPIERRVLRPGGDTTVVVRRRQ